MCYGCANFVRSVLVNSIVPLCVCHNIPIQVIDWQGVQTDLSSLDIKPACARSFLTTLLVCEHAYVSLSLSMPQPSSRKIAIRTPKYLQRFSRGLSNFVKMCGAVERPKGRL